MSHKTDDSTMMFGDSNQIGDLGELVALVNLSRPVHGRYKRPLFRARHLGEKYPVADLIVDVLDKNRVTLGFFFAQVKSTSKSVNDSARLSIVVKKDRYNGLVNLPAPTYLIGVDLVSENTYISAVYKSRQRDLSTMTTQFSLKQDQMKVELYKEVSSFWKLHRPMLQNTRFKDV